MHNSPRSRPDHSNPQGRLQIQGERRWTLSHHFGADYLTKEKSKALNKVTKCNTIMEQDSLLGSLIVLPVELWNGIVG